MEERLPKFLASANPDGDVIVCGHRQVDPAHCERIAFAAPLETRSDLEAILRGLLRFTGVRHVVLCGDDPRPCAAALTSLLRDGLDADGRLRDGRGSLSSDLAATTIDTLLTDIEVHDWRDKPISNLAQGVRGLAVAKTSRACDSVPEAVIPKRKVFHSRRTSFPVFSTDPGDSWLQLITLVLKIGTEKMSPDGERYAQALNAVVTIGLPVIAEDLEVEHKPEIVEHGAYLDFNPDDFDRYFRRLTTSARSSDLRPESDRGARLHELHGFDRFESLCAQLGGCEGEASGATLLFAADEASASRHAPCVLSGTFEITEGVLFGSFVFRQADVYADWPLEAMALRRLHRMIGQRLDLEVGATTFVIHAAHLHDRDWERAGRLLEQRFERPLPLQVDPSGVFLFGDDGGKARGMLLDHGAGTIFWEDEFENAQQLSWYIVDAMPWLLPQHIRYVGQECSTLTRAMEESISYLQG